MNDKKIKLLGTMPTYRDLFPEQGVVGEKFVIRILKDLYLRDCLVVLSQLSKHYYKYCQMGCGGEGSFDIYKKRCFELLSQEIQVAIAKKNPLPPRNYMIIFPELSIIHLIKLCLLHCNSKDYTENGKEFSRETLHNIGKCLLVINSIFADWQLKNVPTKERVSKELLANLTKQLIVDKNFNVFQKMYQNYFIFTNLLKNYKDKFDIEEVFFEKYGVSVLEYFAFLFLLQGQFTIKDEPNEDWDLPFLGSNQALQNLKTKFQKKLLDSLLINGMNYKKIDMSFFNVTDIIKRPLVGLIDDKIIALSLRRLFNRITDSVYFDILDYITDEKQKSKFSKYFGKAIEDYFKDIILAIDKNAIFQKYGKKQNQEANDAILIQKNEIIFFECKKRQFHNLEFLQNGDGDLFFERLKEFCFKPLDQICNKIKDFREERFSLVGVDKNTIIYPVVVFPSSPPFFSGAWDKFKLNKYVLPDYYKQDKKVALPEFIDFSELEYIEEHLKKNPELNFVELIKMKRKDRVYHHSNWKIFLHKNDMIHNNKRLIEKYLEEIKSFKDLLFK